MEFENQGTIRPQSSPRMAPSSSYGFLAEQTRGLRISKIEFAKETPVEKKRINLLVKLDAESSRTKRKAEETLPTIETNETLSDIIVNKKAKKEWKCDVCHINCTSERALKDHLIGKKHKSKQAAAARDGKNYFIGLLSVNAEQQVQVASEPLKIKSREMNGEAKTYKFWCNICKIGTNGEKVMMSHEMGKKHLSRVSKLKDIEAHVNKVDEDGKGISSENVAEPKDDFETVMEAAKDGKHTSIDVAESTDNSVAVVKVDEVESLEEAKDDSNAIVEEKDEEITISSIQLTEI